MHTAPAYDGIPPWELSPAPAEDPDPLSADGWTMHAIAAHAVREGDLLPRETWNRVTFVHDDHEGGVQIEFTYPDGRTGTLQIVAAAKLAVLRHRPPDWFCAHHGEDGMNTDPEPYCHGCVEAGVTTAPAGMESPR